MLKFSCTAPTDCRAGQTSESKHSAFQRAILSLDFDHEHNNGDSGQALNSVGNAWPSGDEWGPVRAEHLRGQR